MTSSTVVFQDWAMCDGRYVVGDVTTGFNVRVCRRTDQPVQPHRQPASRSLAAFQGLYIMERSGLVYVW